MLINGGFTKQERDRLVAAYWESNAKTSWPVFSTLDSEQRQKEYKTQDRLLDEYAERLPFVTIGRCPVTGELVEYPMDPFGFDGMWWKVRDLADYPAAAGSEHLRLVSGAVDFHGREPQESRRLKEVRPGPGCPFVIPNILDMEGMLAVISQLELPRRDIAYVVTYFSEDPVHGGFLSQPWGRDSYQVFNEDGEYEGWTIDTSIWDFDLLPWIKKGKLQWVVPGDNEFILRQEVDCPYLHVDGVRYPQLIQNGVVKLLGLPDGVPAQPFE